MKISVIIPVFNSEMSLCKCLDSVISQTYKDWEVVAIDDGSHDRSFQILLEYASRDYRFKVFSQQNKGPGYTRNKAIKHSEGNYIVFLDSDDYLERDYFQDLVTCVTKNNSDVIFIDLVQENSDGRVIKFEYMSKYKHCTKDTIIRHQMTGKLPWGGCRKAIKASIIIDNNIEYSNDVVGEEALFSLRVLMKSNNISFLDRPYYHYINYPDSQSKKGDNNPWGGICIEISRYLEKQGIFNEYKKTINSFGYTAFIVSIYRISQNHSLVQSIRLSKEELKKFRSIYTFDLDCDSLELRTKYLIPFAKIGILFPIVFAAKIKSALKRILLNK